MDAEKFFNHTRINQLLVRGRDKLHFIFHQRWMLYKNLEWNNGKKCKTELILLCEAAQPQIKENLKTNSVDLWDITATCYAILAISKKITTKFKEDKAIVELREERNIFVHSAKSEYTLKEFNIKWNRVANVLVKLGDTHIELDKYKDSLLKIGKIEAVETKRKAETKSPTDKNQRRKGLFKAENALNKTSQCQKLEKEPIPTSSAYVEQIPDTATEAIDEFKTLKEKANVYFKNGEYPLAIETYSQILKLSGVTPENKATIFSNRSAAYLLLKDEKYLGIAEMDAEWAIQLWPCWWRGYFRLGRAQARQEKWLEAEDSFSNALMLDPLSKEVEDELSAVRSKIGILSRGEHLKVVHEGASPEDLAEEVQKQLGIDRDVAKKYLKEFNNFPIIKAHNYRDGAGVVQDYGKAAYYYEIAARKGEVEAMYNLGQLYNSGKGIPRDYDEAMIWLMKAATTKENRIGVKEAQHLLGLKYNEGVGVKKDIKKAIEWYEKAFHNGLGHSANNLGVLYDTGEGVEKSLTKAIKYFKASAELGDTQGMINLADCYFNARGTGSILPTETDIREGMKWLQRAADKGDLLAVRRLEKKQNYSNEQFEREAFEKVVNPDMDIQNDPLDKELYKTEITKAAQKSSSTAQQILKIWEYIDFAIEHFKNNDTGAVVNALANAIRLNFMAVKIPQIFVDVIQQKIETMPEDTNSLICFLQICLHKSEFLNLYSKCLPLLFENELFIKMQIKCYMEEGKIKEALESARKACQRFPASLEIMYLQARAYCLQEKSVNDCIVALDAFIGAAPEDHEKVPECYYLKAQYFLRINNIPKFCEFVETGLAAEKKQLPCYLPYFFPSKKIMEKVYEIEKERLQNALPQGNSIPSAISKLISLNDIKSNVQRRRLLIKHREAFVQYATELLVKGKSPITFPTEKKALPPSLISLKKIVFNDMDPTIDKTYDGFVLEAKIIDWAYLIKGIATIIEDENGDIQRLALYNWPLKNNMHESFADSVKTFRPNVKISIINPYMRISHDHQSLIRAESPAHVKLDETLADQKCCCCGKEAKVLMCSQCRMSHYCSKECQKVDWTNFQHKTVCKWLKKFSTNPQF